MIKKIVIASVFLVAVLLAGDAKAQSLQLVPKPTGAGICIQTFGKGAACVNGLCAKEGASSGVGPGAAETLPGPNQRPVECDYTFCDLMRVLTEATKIIFGLAGGLALVYFMYGAFWLIAAFGNSEYVKKGTTSMKEAVIGLVIVLVAYQLVGTLALVFLRGASGTDTAKFEKGVLSIGWAETISKGCEVSAIQKPRFTK